MPGNIYARFRIGGSVYLPSLPSPLIAPLRALERILQFKLAVLVYKCLHRTAPSYLADKLQCPADFDARRRLRSTSSSSLTVWRTRLSTVGDRAFPVDATRTLNSLPQVTRHVRILYVYFPGTPGGFPLQAFLSLTRYRNLFSAYTQWHSSFSDIWIVLFTYFFTYSVRFTFTAFLSRPIPSLSVNPAWERWRFPQRVSAKLRRQTHFDEFWSKKYTFHATKHDTLVY